MERVLEKANSGSSLPALEHCLHQLASDPRVLPFGCDRNWSDPSNRAPLIKKVGADYASVNLGDHAPDHGMWDERVQDAGGSLERREVALKPVVIVEGAERVKDDLGALVGVSRFNWPKGHLSGGWARGVHRQCLMR